MKNHSFTDWLQTQPHGAHGLLAGCLGVPLSRISALKSGATAPRLREAVLIAAASAGAVALETWPELTGAEAEAQRLRRELAGLRVPRSERRDDAAACPQVAA